MVVVPAETPVTNPVPETVATPGLEEVHGVPGSGLPDPVSCTVPPIQIGELPLIVGFAFTVTKTVVWHPFELVYVIVALPAATPVTRPVPETVATPGFELTHGFTPAGVGDPVSCTVAPTQIGALPEIVGSAFTVTTTEV
jgi:hypothetical protein